MRNRLTCIVNGWSMLVLTLPANFAWSGDLTADNVELGRQLFQREWEYGQSAIPGGDGLGPVHNEVSCAACHSLSGDGGAGSIAKNVDLLTVENRHIGSHDVQRRLQKIHPSFVNESGHPNRTILLHRFGKDQRYALTRAQLLSRMPVDDQHGPTTPHLQRRMGLEPIQRIIVDELVLLHSQRSTPALFGAGLIDKIPATLIRKLAKAQNKKFPGVTGRLAPVGHQIGRFGWRGQTAHLHDFVLDACANELGLEVPGREQGIDPFRGDYRAPGLDLSAEQCIALSSYVASLPPPRQIMPDSSAQIDIARRGEQIFHSVGCAACHVRAVGPAKDIYSDLLLHDMGPSLTDPVPVNDSASTASQAGTSYADAVSDFVLPTLAQLTRPAFLPTKPRNHEGFNRRESFQQALAHQMEQFTSFAELAAAANHVFASASTTRHQEWRTPPLWGVADSAPYLHDGRAETLLEAILLHGGEAQFATANYLARPIEDRMAVLRFLETLRAPRPKP